MSKNKHQYRDKSRVEKGLVKGVKLILIAALILFLGAIATLVFAAPAHSHEPAQEASPAVEEARERTFDWQEFRERLESEGVPPQIAGRVQGALNDIESGLSRKLERVAGRMERDVDEAKAAASDARSASRQTSWLPWGLFAVTLLGYVLLVRRVARLEDEVRSQQKLIGEVHTKAMTVEARLDTQARLMWPPRTKPLVDFKDERD